MTATYSEAETEAKGHNIMPLSVLEAEHYTPLARAISNVLSTDIAKSTFAQIVDGEPLLATVAEYHISPLCDAKPHPISSHTELCHSVLERAEEFRSQFDLSSMRLDAQSLMEYRAASPGSRAFNTRLVELVARAVHEIVIAICKADISFHKEDSLARYEPPRDKKIWWRHYPNGAPPTLLFHRWYRDYRQYPEGVADGIGFWAENRIFGGVVLFDRHQPDCHDIFFHPDRLGHTYRIFKLLDEQKTKLLAFLLSDAAPGEFCPIPILPSDDNRDRVDPEEPLWLTHIYRDLWERKAIDDDYHDARGMCRWDVLNYTSLEDFNAAQERWMTRFERYRERDWDA